MATSTITARTALSGKEWRILALLFVSGLINYIDRTTLSVGATNIQRELGLNNEQIGMLHSGFFFVYAASQLFSVAGWITDRFHVGWVLGLGFLIWSGATAYTGIAQSFLAIMCMRVILGMGESVSYPSYSRILAAQYPEHHRGFANALIDAGTKTGPALGTLIGGLLVSQLGWRPFFLVLGLGSMLWLIPWFAWMPRGKGVSANEDRSDVASIGDILRLRSAWFSAFGLFCTNYFWYFLITWLPAYLEKERHFPKSKMAVLGSIPFVAIAISAVTAGMISDRLIAAGRSPTVVRKSFAGIGLAFSTIILPVVWTRATGPAMALLILSCISFGIYTSNLFAITQTIAGPRAAGKWTGFQNGFGNLAGVAAPWLTGRVVDQTGEFYWAFVVAAGFVLAGAAIFVFGIGRVEPARFGSARA